MVLPISVSADLFTTNRLPTNKEYTQLTQHIDDHEIRITELDKTISQLTKELNLNALQAERAALIADIAHAKQALAPIRRVPDDVLREIFLACLDSKWNPTISITEAPMLLTQISNNTRGIALTTPALWAAIHIAGIWHVSPARMAGAQDIMVTRAQAVREWLLRSGSLPLSISVYAHSEEASRTASVIREICQFSCRWKAVSFSCAPDALADVYALGLDNFPLLQSVSLKLTGIYDDVLASNVAGASILRAPRLTELDISFPADLSCFKDTITWANITHICFPSPPDDAPNASFVNDIVDLLHQMPRLVSCEICIYHDQHVPDVIHLPCLKALTIDICKATPEGVMGFLGAIRAPILNAVSYNLLSSVDEYPHALIHLLQYSPIVTELVIGPRAKASYIMDCVRHCPQLRTLNIHELAKVFTLSDEPFPGNALLAALVPDVDESCVPPCPKLEHFRWDDAFGVSSSSLQKFLERKRYPSESGIATWKTVLLQLVVTDPDDIVAFNEIREGELGRDTHFIFESIRPYMFNTDSADLPPEDHMWPSQIPRAYLR